MRIAPIFRHDRRDRQRFPLAGRAGADKAAGETAREQRSRLQTKVAS